jgi:hypothetical protein
MEPLILGGGAAYLGSAIANMFGAGAVNNARSHAIDDQIRRQAAFDAEVAGINAHSLGLYNDFPGQQAARGQQLGDLLAKSSASASAVPTQLSAATPGIVQQEEARQLGKSAAFNDQQGRAMGDLRSFGDVLADTSRAQARDAGKIAQIGSFKRGTAALLPLYLDNAQQAGAGWKTLADVLQGAGSIATTAGLLRPRPPMNLLDFTTPTPVPAGTPSGLSNEHTFNAFGLY